MSDSRTILQVIQGMTAYFERHEVAPARRTAELLVAHHLSLPRLELYLRFEQTLAESDLVSLRELARRRADAEPTAYLLGVADFAGAELKVDRRALIPRPETEILVEKLLEKLPPGDGWILDVGTGSGAIAIAAILRRPGLRAVGIDRSAAALELAAENAARHGLGERLRLVRSRSLSAFRGPIPDLLAIVANPPYVPSGDIPGLPREVRDFEPREALDGGVEGLDAFRELIPRTPALLAPGRWLVTEVGHDQAAAVGALMADAGFARVEYAADYHGIQRIVMGER